MCQEMNKMFIGKKIKSFFLEDDGRSITFFFDDGSLKKLYAYDDCCSYTWIESLDNEDAWKDATVINCEDIEMPNLGNIPGGRFKEIDDCVQYYGMKITTNKGVCVIDYRNSSNGYYGGSLELRD